jgi:AcrR family transcriptional regulator
LIPGRPCKSTYRAGKCADKDACAPHLAWASLGRMPKANAQVAQVGSDEVADTPARLAEAAVHLISEEGWAAVTTRRVAHRAGVNQGVVHYHYGSVAALRRQAALQAMNAVFEPAIAGLLEADDIGCALGHAIEAIQQIDPQNPATIVSFEAMLQSQRDPELRAQLHEMLNDFRAVLHDRLALAARRGRLRPGVDIRGLALLLAAALDGIGLHRAIDSETSVAPAGASLRSLLGTDS